VTADSEQVYWAKTCGILQACKKTGDMYDDYTETHLHRHRRYSGVRWRFHMYNF
jgi:hypothetical protein